jgi:GNAT superfamily N-acetyltransferase
MSLPAWHEEPISKKHDRKSFDCGDAAMNDFLRRYARQGHEAGAAKTFVAIGDADSKAILGFYSLAPGALAYADAPEMVRRGLARHDVPGFRLARIATDRRCQGQGLGGQLLVAAAKRCLRAAVEVGGVVLIIDAKNDSAARWYASYGAIALGSKPLTLVMSLATFATGLQIAGRL